MQKKILVSFVVPAHNEEENIGDCLDSIFEEIRRSGVNAEVIVVNNRSTDRTRDIAAFKGAIVVDEETKGIVWARQRGLNESRGELIANIDADNHLPEGWLSTAQYVFERNPRLACFSGPLIYRDVPSWARVISKVFYIFGLGLMQIARIIGIKGGIVQGGNFVFRKEFMLKAGGYDTNIEFYGEDTAVAVKLAPFGKIKFSFKLPISSSGRRLLKEGVVKTGFRYAINFFWVTVFGHPFNMKSTDIRS